MDAFKQAKDPLWKQAWTEKIEPFIGTVSSILIPQTHYLLILPFTGVLLIRILRLPHGYWFYPNSRLPSRIFKYKPIWRPPCPPKLSTNARLPLKMLAKAGYKNY